jgi:hypothetical protein
VYCVSVFHWMLQYLHLRQTLRARDRVPLVVYFHLGLTAIQTSNSKSQHSGKIIRQPSPTGLTFSCALPLLSDAASWQ